MSLWPFSRKNQFDAALEPETPFVAIGDIHGSIDALDALRRKLPDGLPQIYVGDYVDRGPESAAVLRTLAEAQNRNPNRVICLKGNHEDMMLTFLMSDGQAGQRWLKFGGLETCMSLNVSGLTKSPTPERSEVIARQAKDALGLDLLSWIEDLPTSWQSGNVFVTHAAADPNAPTASQNPNDLLWGHKDFMTTPRSDGVWVVHGHTIVDAVTAEAGRLAIDTGAYASGRLSAVQIAAGTFTVISSDA